MKIVFESAFIVSQLKWDEIVGYFYCFLLTIKILYEVQSLRGQSWSQFHLTTMEFYLSKTIVLQNNWMLKVESPGRIISLTADIEIKYYLDITSIRWRGETIFFVDNIFSGQGSPLASPNLGFIARPSSAQTRGEENSKLSENEFWQLWLF